MDKKDIVYDTKDLFIYNYKTGKMSSYQNVNGDVLVNNNEFKVNLSSDIIIINNKEKLLMKNFDYLKKLKWFNEKSYCSNYNFINNIRCCLL